MVPTHKCLPLQGIQVECTGVGWGGKPNQEAVPGYNNGTNPKLNPFEDALGKYIQYVQIKADSSMEVQHSVCNMPENKSAYSTKSQITSNFEFSERPHVKLMRNQLITSQRPVGHVPHVCCHLDCIFFFFWGQQHKFTNINLTFTVWRNLTCGLFCWLFLYQPGCSITPVHETAKRGLSILDTRLYARKGVPSHRSQHKTQFQHAQQLRSPLVSVPTVSALVKVSNSQ